MRESPATAERPARAGSARGPTPTPVELLRALAVLAEPPERGHGAVAAALGLPATPTAAEYAEVFTFQLYPYASVHLGPEGMLGGAARDRIAGFWRALGRTPPAEPDHLSALLGLYVSLTEAEHGAAGDAASGTAAPAERALLGSSRAALLHEHLVPWVFAYLDRVQELAGPVYRRWAVLLSAVLGDEVRRRPPGADLPVHQRACGPLPDPREGGGDAFLRGLLAPARSGVIVTRADLARVALEGGLGLRAGERRYALEHLLAQAPATVLEALAREASRQAEGHARRTADLGAAARHAAARARATASLLRALAVDAEPVLA